MAKSSIHTNPVVRLELSTQEALWLRALLQNPIGFRDTEDEWNREFRESIFSALPRETDLHSSPS